MSDKQPVSPPSNPAKKISLITEEERLLRNIYRPDMEKLHLFTQMLRVNALYKKAKITHK